MARDYEQFPDDENGDVLFRMMEHGDNLSKRREINFSVVFPTDDAALEFAVHLLKNGQKVSLSPNEVTAHPNMIPSHDNITGYENLLAKDAAKWDGRNDGWGSFQQD